MNTITMKLQADHLIEEALKEAKDGSLGLTAGLDELKRLDNIKFVFSSS